MRETLKVWDSLMKDESMVPSNKLRKLDPIPTPSPSVNWALEGGIIPGRIYCYDGPESGGKSFFAMECVKELLKTDPNGIVIWYDAEMSFSTHWRDKLIAPDDQERILVRSTNVSSEVFDHFNDKVVDIIETKGGKVLGCVLDSLQSLIPPREAKITSTTDVVMGDLSQYMPKALRRIMADSRKHAIPWIIISQVRQNMDPNAKYSGRQYIVSGGMAFRHATDVELLFERANAKDTKIYGDMKNMNDSSEQLGHTVKVKVMKNRVGKPHRTAEFKLHYDKGVVQTNEEVFKLARNLGVITMRGATYSFDGQVLATGKDKAIDLLSSSSELRDTIMKKVMETKSDNMASADDVMLTEAGDELDL